MSSSELRTLAPAPGVALSYDDAISDTYSPTTGPAANQNNDQYGSGGINESAIVLVALCAFVLVCGPMLCLFVHKARISSETQLQDFAAYILRQQKKRNHDKSERLNKALDTLPNIVITPNMLCKTTETLSTQQQSKGTKRTTASSQASEEDVQDICVNQVDGRKSNRDSSMLVQNKGSEVHVDIFAMQHQQEQMQKQQQQQQYQQETIVQLQSGTTQQVEMQVFDTYNKNHNKNHKKAQQSGEQKIQQYQDEANIIKQQQAVNNKVQKVISTWSEEVCVICLEEWQVGAHVVELPCLHKLHRECARQWGMRQSRGQETCPQCQGCMFQDGQSGTCSSETCSSET